MSRRLRCALVGFSLFATVPLLTERPVRAEDAAPSAGVDALLGRFRTMPGLYAKYREEKTIALLAKPLVSEGTIHYAPQKHLARHTLTPQTSSVVLDADTLRFGDGSSEEKVDLGASPVVKAFVAGFSQLLAGDRAGLEQTFSIELKPPPAADKWEIVLRPKLPALAGVITEMSFTGQGAVVSRMRVVEKTGDVAVTTFTDVDPKKKYSAEETARIFRLPSSKH